MDIGSTPPSAEVSGGTPAVPCCAAPNPIPSHTCSGATAGSCSSSAPGHFVPVLASQIVSGLHH